MLPLGLNFISKPYLEGVTYLGTLFPNQPTKKSSKLIGSPEFVEPVWNRAQFVRGFYNKKGNNEHQKC